MILFAGLLLVPASASGQWSLAQIRRLERPRRADRPRAWVGRGARPDRRTNPVPLIADLLNGLQMVELCGPIVGLQMVHTSTNMWSMCMLVHGLDVA